MTFDELRDDFLRIVSDVVWCTVATVDTRGRPRTRVMHPYWEVVDGAPRGWIGTSKVSAQDEAPRREPARLLLVLVAQARDRARRVPRLLGG